MKIRLLLISLSICLYLTTYAQTNPEKKESSNVPGIVFNKTTHDFGELIQFAPAFCEFRFYNRGRTPLIVSEVSASCGCTVPSWSKNPIMPGDSGIIKVIYLTAETGAIDKMVTVYSNATKMPVSLELKGKVIKEE